MELSRDIIIDALLNVGAYVTAGAFWLVLYSMFTNRSRAAVPATKTKSAPALDEPRQGDTKRRAEYVSLASSNASRDADLEERERLRAEATRYQRNRVEVIRIAREMLKSGQNRDKIRSLLPISEGELALLSNE
ncbi:MAG: hypothetical protein IPH75_01455 [bacterium]|nr:hypothetical protein [bacterium]